MPAGTISPKTISDRILYLDAGNTRIKAAIHELGVWKSMGAFNYDELDGETSGKTGLTDKLVDLCKDFYAIVLVSVKRRLQAGDLEKKIRAEVIGIDRQILTPDKHRYRTPETLGIDRYLACLGAWSFDRAVPNAVIVTDAGTACTVDAMDAMGVYHGGVIMPGVRMLIDVLGHGADGLFPVSPEIPESWPPDSTTTALQAGTAGTFLAAWEAHVRHLKSVFPNANIWLTGGDAGFLKRHSEIHCLTNDFLVFEGMRHWFEHS